MGLGIADRWEGRLQSFQPRHRAPGVAHSALVLGLVGGLFGTSQVAWAQQQQCGAPDASGQVVCPPAVYPNGIAYTAPAPLGVILQQDQSGSVAVPAGGVQLTTSGAGLTALTRGLAGSAGDVGPVLVNESGDAVSVTNNAGPVMVDLRDPGGAGANLSIRGFVNGVTASSSGSGGTNVYLGAGAVLARTGSGVQVTSSGPVVVDTGTASISAAGDGVSVQQIGATGGVTVTTNGLISGINGQSGDAAILIGAGNTANTDPIQVSVGGPLIDETGGVRITSLGSRDVSVDTGAGALIQASQDGINVTTAGTGKITVSTGANITGDTNSGTVGNALTLTSDAGAIQVTTAAGTTLSTKLGPFDVVAKSNAGDVVVNNGAMLAGVNATGVSATSGTGSLAIVSTGAMGSTAQAIRQGVAADITGGTGTLQLTTSSSIYASGTVAISTVNAGTGASTVTIAGGGVMALAGDGLRVTGGAGTTTVAVAAGASVTGNSAVVAAGSGAVAVTNAGAITGNSNGSAVRLDPLGATSATLTNTATGVIQGAGDVQNDAAVFLGGVGGADIENAGVIQALAVPDHLGVVFEGAGFGATTINNAAGGSIDGRILAGDGGVNFTNSGTWTTNGGSVFGSDAGAAQRTFVNVGTLQVGATAGVAASQTSFTGLGLTRNSGVISLANGVTGDNLSLSGSYVGAAPARLLLDISSTAAGVKTDTLTIAGQATGATTVTLASQGTLGFTPRTLLVQAATGSSLGAFSLAPGAANLGLVHYSIVYDPTSGGYYLVSSPDAVAAEFAQFSEIRHNLWFATSQAVSNHLAALRDAQGPSSDRVATGLYTWSEAVGGVHDRSLNQSLSVEGTNFSYNQGYNQSYEGVQVGLELIEQLFEGSATAGVTAGYINSSANFSSTGDDLDLSEFNVGAYANYNTPLFFINGLLKADLGSEDIDSKAGDFKRSFDTRQFGVLLETGHRFQFRGWFVEPVASIGYIHGYIAGGDTTTGAGGDESQNTLSMFGASVIFPDDNSARGQAKFRVGADAVPFLGTTARPYVELGAAGEFAGGDKVVISFPASGLSIPNARPSAFGVARLGAELWKSSNLMVNAQADALFGDAVVGGGGNISASYRW